MGDKIALVMITSEAEFIILDQILSYLSACTSMFILTKSWN